MRMIDHDPAATACGRNTLVISNARIVMAERIVPGSLVVDDGRIVEIEENSMRASGMDFDGDYLIPGIVDMHTDNLERHFFPRPSIDWDPVSAAIAHDGACMASGITTVLDSFSLGSWNKSEARGLANLRRLLGGMDQARRSGALRADHHVHWRCELPAPHLPELVEEFMPHPKTRLASLMDHTPGQRQYRDLEFFLNRNWRSELDAAEIDARLASRRAEQASHVETHRAHVASVAARHGVVLAAHDDETAAHVHAAHAAGAVIAEFPVTQEAAAEARRLGMINIMGGPNLVRGGSYSGNVSAAELAATKLLDGFASDYVPRSLIECAFRLVHPDHGWALPAAVATVTSVPAQALGFTDRGEIGFGMRADMVRVSLNGGLPVVRAVWVAGQRQG